MFLYFFAKKNTWQNTVYAVKLNHKEIREVLKMNKSSILKWFFNEDAENHGMSEVVALVAGAGIFVVGVFALGWLVGMF